MRDGAAHLAPRPLAFDDLELARAARGRARGAPTGEQVGELQRLTLGWPAAAALAAAWLARAPTAAASRAFAAGGSMAALLDELLDGLGTEQRRRVSSPRPPAVALARGRRRMCRSRLDAAAGRDRPAPARRPPRLARARRPGPRRARCPRPLPPTPPARLPTAYGDAGELATGLALLTAAGSPDDLAAMIAGRRWQELAALELAELRAILTTLPEEALAAEPFALVQVARLAEQDGDLELRAELLDRALPFVGDGAQRPRGRGGAGATHAMVDPARRSRRGRGGPCRRRRRRDPRPRSGADGAGPGRGLARRSRPILRGGEPADRGGGALPARGRGRVGGAHAHRPRLPRRFRPRRPRAGRHPHERALALLPDSGTERAAGRDFLAEGSPTSGASTRPKRRSARPRRSGAISATTACSAYAAWTETMLASLRGDAAATIQRIRTVELHPGDWFEHPTGIEFLADAALALARRRARGRAEYAARAPSARTPPAIRRSPGSEGAVAARWATRSWPTSAGRFAASPQQAPRDEWRTLLFRAQAASRAVDDPRRRRSPPRPTRRRRRSGAPTCRARTSPTSPRSSSRSRWRPARARRRRGRGGDAVHGHRARRLRASPPPARALRSPPGRPSTLVKVLALATRRSRSKRRSSCCGPTSSGPTGRQRLRNLLNRCARAAASSCSATSAALVLAPAEVDAAGFERAAAAAMAAAAGAGRDWPGTALARYAGELLPIDRYEAWATAPRERLRRRYLELLDLLADDAVERGDVDEAIRLLDQSPGGRAAGRGPLRARCRAAALPGPARERRPAGRPRARSCTTELGVLGSSQRLERLQAASSGG